MALFCIAKVNDAFVSIITNLIAGRRSGTFNILTSSRIPRQIILFNLRQTAMQSSAMKNEGLSFQRTLGYWFESLLFQSHFGNSTELQLQNTE